MYSEHLRTIVKQSLNDTHWEEKVVVDNRSTGNLDFQKPTNQPTSIRGRKDRVTWSHLS